MNVHIFLDRNRKFFLLGHPETLLAPGIQDPLPATGVRLAMPLHHHVGSFNDVF